MATRNRFSINNLRVLRLIDGCTEDFKNWGYKLPSEIVWYSAECTDRLGLANHLNSSITLSSFLFKEKDELIKATIYHEMAHLAAGPFAKHGPKWQKIAADVSKRTGLNIKRLADPKEYKYFGSDEYQEKFKYVFKCRSCGLEIHRTKMSEFVRTYADTIIVDGIQKPRWTCPKCGGRFERIK